MATGVKRYLRDVVDDILLPYTVSSAVIMSDGTTNVEDKVEYLDNQIASLTVSGMPKLVSYEYDIYGTVDNQVKYEIPYDYYNAATDTLEVSINGTDVPKSYYTVTQPVENAGVITKGFITLKTGRPNGTYVKIRILKNVPMGSEGSINGTVISPGTIPTNRVIGLTDMSNKVAQLANPNVLINGDFQVWQRGTTFSNPASGNIYCADRWNFSVYGSVGTPNQQCVISKTVDGLNLVCTNPTGDGNTIWRQPLSSVDIDKLKGKVVTLSFKVKYTNIAQIAVTFNTTANSGYEGTNNTTFVSTKSTVADYVTFSTTFTVPSNATVLVPQILLSVPSNQVSSYTINYVKLEIGDKATPLISKPYNEELNACLRFYEVGASVRGIIGNLFRLGCYINYKAVKRTLPVVTLSSGGNKSKVLRESDGTLFSYIIYQNHYEDFGVIDLSANAVNGDVIAFDWVSDAEIY